MGRMISLLVLLLLLPACDPPALPVTGERYVIAFEEDTPGAPTGWRAEHRRALAAMTTILGRTGASFRFGELAEADIVLRTFDSGARCEDGGGYYPLTGGRGVWIDYACAHGDDGLRLVCAHEIGHWLELRRHGTIHHLCLRAADATDVTLRCYPGIYGAGVLNPWYPGEFDEEGNPLGPPSPAFTEGDLAVLGPRDADGADASSGLDAPSGP